MLLPASGRVTVRDARAGHEWDEDTRDRTLSLDEARRRALLALRETGASPREVESLGPFLQDLITPSMVFDGALSESRRQEAEGRVEPLIVRIPKGKLLVRQNGGQGERLVLRCASSPDDGRSNLAGDAAQPAPRP